ncbi:MAG: hypothetical protein ACKO9F_02625, partial [Caldilinea sp.]
MATHENLTAQDPTVPIDLAGKAVKLLTLSPFCQLTTEHLCGMLVFRTNVLKTTVLSSPAANEQASLFQ